MSYLSALMRLWFWGGIVKPTGLNDSFTFTAKFRNKLDANETKVDNSKKSTRKKMQ